MYDRDRPPNKYRETSPPASPELVTGLHHDDMPLREAEYPDEHHDLPHPYAGATRLAQSMSQFLDQPGTHFDDPAPVHSTPTRRIPIVGFFVLMAVIGSSSAALWFYYGPKFDAPFFSARVDKTVETLNRLADQQAKLTQSVAGLRATHDAFQKAVAAREQELQRLSAESQALRTDVSAVRAGLADLASSQVAHPAKSAPAPTKARKADHKAAPEHKQPPGGAPRALSPQ